VSVGELQANLHLCQGLQVAWHLHGKVNTTTRCDRSGCIDERNEVSFLCNAKNESPVWVYAMMAKTGAIPQTAGMVGDRLSVADHNKADVTTTTMASPAASDAVLVDCSTGKSLGFIPCKVLST